MFWKRLVTIFSCIVVFCTTYMLILPAITMERETHCGIEEHQHDESCYEERLICGQKEGKPHHHTDDCYTVEKELICKDTEHAHSDGCYDKEGNLTCALEEHFHSDECYREDRILSCSLEETDGHTHSAGCYEKVLVCGKETHTHSAGCYVNDDKNDRSGTDAGAGEKSDTVRNRLKSLGDVFRENKERYQAVKSITGLSLFTYLIIKIQSLFLISRK